MGIYVFLYDAPKLGVCKMDITLKRIMSLMPKKPDGKPVHGARTEFAKSIGAPANIFAEWVAGRNSSYKNYVYEIAAKYDVAADWLLGLTDEKTPAAPKGDERSAKEIALEKIGEIAEQGSDAELIELLAAITERLKK